MKGRLGLHRRPPRHNLLSIGTSDEVKNKRARAKAKIKNLVYTFCQSLNDPDETSSEGENDERIVPLGIEEDGTDEIEAEDSGAARRQCSSSTSDRGSDGLDWLVDLAESGHCRSQELLSYITLTSVAKSGADNLLGIEMATKVKLEAGSGWKRTTMKRRKKEKERR